MTGSQYKQPPCSFRVSIMTLIYVVVFTIFICGSCPAAEKTRVLFISAYHPGFPTFFQQVNGIKTVLDPHDILLDIEFMDSKRFSDKKHQDIFETYLRHKLTHTAPYDVVITGDDNALKFATRHQQSLFESIPILFIGINDIEMALEQDKNPWITGVIESLSIKETIELMIRLFPDFNTIVALSDNTITGQADLKMFYRATLNSAFETTNFSDISLSVHTWPDFLNELEKLDSRALVLLLAAYTDKFGKTLLFDQSLEEITNRVSAPIFHPYHHGIGNGIFGGKVISHEQQGRTVANLVLEILNGKPVNKMKVIRSSPNEFVFDYNQLKKYGIDPSRLPGKSKILDQPSSYFRDNRTLILGAMGIILILSVFLGIFLFNIRRRITVEKNLRNHKLQLQTIMGTIPDLVWLKDTDGVYLSCNQKFQRFFGARESEILGKTDYDFVDKDQADIFRANDMAAIQAGGPRKNEEEIIYANDGHREIVETIKTPVYNHENNITGVLGIARDISGRIMRQKELVQSEQRFRELFHNMGAGVAICVSPDGGQSFHFKDMNKVGLDYLEKDSRDLMGKELRNVFPQAEDMGLLSLFRRVYRTGIAQHYPATFYTDDRLKIWITGYVCKLPSGELVIIINDTTEKINADQAKKRLEAQVHRSHTMEALGALAGSIAHDFNNILFPILGYAEIMNEDLLADHPHRAYIEKVISGAHRASELVSQIRHFSRRKEQGKGAIQLAIIVKEVISFMRAALPATIKIQINIENNCKMVNADPTQVHQIVMNLVTNALQAMEDSGGTLGIRLENIDDHTTKKPSSANNSTWVRLRVSDTGIGIDDHTLEKIFEPYFTTKDEKKGTGLGLATVRDILDNYKGKIDVKSIPGQGSRFDIYFPALPETPQRIPETQEREQRGGYERILLVDDEKQVLDVEKRFLSKLGYRVTAMHSSPQALEFVQKNPGMVDLVVTDMIMPDMTGDILARDILSRFPDIPIIICTGYSEKIDRQTALGIGVRSLLYKPVAKHEFAEAVRTALDGTDT